MYLLSYIHFAVFLLFLFLSINTIRRSIASPVHRAFGTVFFCFAFWSLSFVFINNPIVNKQLLIPVVHIASVANLGFGIYTFIGIITFVRPEKRYPVLYTAALIYLTIAGYLQVTGKLAYPYYREGAYNFWVIKYNNHIVIAIFNIIHNSLIVASLTLLLYFVVKTSDKIKKRCALITLVTGATSFFMAFFNVYIAHHHFNFPLIPDILLLPFIIGMYFNMHKLDLFEITPTKVANRIIEIMPTGLLLADRENRIVTANNALLQLTGYKIKSMMNRNLNDWLVLISDRKDLDFLSKRFSDIQITSRTNQIFQIELSTEVLTDKYGDVIGTICLFKDITRYRNIENELKNMNNKLETKVKERTKELETAKHKAEESDRLKSAFLANISHEIRTPLNGIMGFSELLHIKKYSETQDKIYTNAILENSRQLLVIIEDVLDISTIETGQMKVKNEELLVDNLTDALFAEYKSIAEDKGLLFQYEKPTNMNHHTILTDKSHLKKILTNLIKNAIKFTSFGYVKLGYEYRGNYEICFYVEDSGIGISAEWHKAIFEPFRQIDGALTREYGGTGLGLAITKQLVELLGGKIWLHSEPDKGTVFYFTIPLISTS